jgi:hypothetical protein
MELQRIRPAQSPNLSEKFRAQAKKELVFPGSWEAKILENQLFLFVPGLT